MSRAEGPLDFAGTKLEAALVANAVQLSKNAAAGLPETWNLVQVEMAATNFSSFSAAAAPSIHKFLQQPQSTVSLKAARQSHTDTDEQQAAACQVVTTASGLAQSSEQNQQLSKQSVEAMVHKQALLQPMESHQDTAEQDVLAMEVGRQGARQCYNDREGLQSSAMYDDVDIEQQRQMLREIELRHSSTRQQRSSQIGMKRTHTGQHSKVGVKQSKSEHTTGPGQQTITSLFGKKS